MVGLCTLVSILKAVCSVCQWLLLGLSQAEKKKLQLFLSDMLKLGCVKVLVLLCMVNHVTVRHCHVYCFAVLLNSARDSSILQRISAVARR